MVIDIHVHPAFFEPISVAVDAASPVAATVSNPTAVVSIDAVRPIVCS